MNSDATAISFYINAISIRHRRKLHVNISIDINITISYFHTGAFVEVIRTVLDYQLVSLDGGCTFNCLLEQRHCFIKVTIFSHQCQLVIACINSQRCFYLYSSLSCSSNSSVSCENILTIFNIAGIFSIGCSITGQNSSELSFRRNNGCLGNIRAFTLFGEGDVAGLQGCGRSSQTISNLHKTGQVLLTGYKVAVSQLTCQCVQYVGYASFVIHRYTGVVGDQGYDRAFGCLSDDGVARFVVLSRFAISFMRVEDVGIAAVVADSQAIIILLENVACFGFALAAGKVGYTAACPFFAAPRILDNRINHFVVPGCAVLQPQVCITGKGLVTGFLASFGKAVLYDAGQAGFSS